MIFGYNVFSCRLLGQKLGETAEAPLLDPCLPTDLQDEVGAGPLKLHLRGTGDFDECRQLLQPFLNRTNQTNSSLNGIYQPPIDYSNSQFYGFSEFYYCTEDVLRMGGDYNSSKYTSSAKVNNNNKINNNNNNNDTEFYYCTEDVLRMGGDYNSSKYTNSAKVSVIMIIKWFLRVLLLHGGRAEDGWGL